MNWCDTFFAEWRNEGGIIVNNVQMPDPPPQPARRHGGSLRAGAGGGQGRGGPTPADKRVLVQEEFDKRYTICGAVHIDGFV